MSSRGRSTIAREDPATPTFEVIDDWANVHAHLPQWDELAAACSKPYCAPAWMGAWWLHAAPSGSMLRLILVYDGSTLVGVAPFFADGRPGLMTRYRVLGARCSSSVDLLARPGMEADVGWGFVTALAEVDPRPDVVMFEGARADSPWPGVLAGGWPGRSTVLRPQFSLPAPRVEMRGLTYDDWFASKSGHFRQSMRRSLRQLEREGASFRQASTNEELERDLRSFAELHYRRWNRRGGSGVLNRRVERMLLVAGKELIDTNRFRLWSIDVEGRPISSHLFLSAGTETSYWLGGFDEEWARLQVTLVTVLTAIKQAFAVGDQRFDLGAGGQDYKYRMADGDEQVDWSLVVPKGLRSTLARMQVLPERTRLAVAERLRPETKRAIRELRGRLRGVGRSGRTRPPADGA